MLLLPHPQDEDDQSASSQSVELSYFIRRDPTYLYIHLPLYLLGKYS